MIYLIRDTQTCVCETAERAAERLAQGWRRVEYEEWASVGLERDLAILAAMRQAADSAPMIVTIPASVEVLPPAQWVAPWRLYPVDGKGRG